MCVFVANAVACKITFEIGLDDEDLDKQEMLDVFRVDKDYEQNERAWRSIRAEILGESDDGSGSSSGSDSDEEEESGGEGSGWGGPSGVPGGGDAPRAAPSAT